MVADQQKGRKTDLLLADYPKSFNVFSLHVAGSSRL
jgi:hypothetical protein